MKTIYISGPMTGIKDHNKPLFDFVAKELRENGYVVKNPAEVEEAPSKTWSDYMREDLRLLLECDTIVLLPGWAVSRGARIEVELATALGMCIISAEFFFTKEELTK